MIIWPLIPFQSIVVRFIPEVVVMGTDPITGLLIQQFTVLYGVANRSGQYVTHQGRPVGEVSIQVPYKTILVSSWTKWIESCNEILVQHFILSCFFSHFQEVQPASFTLEILPCPGGYVLQQHTSKTDVNVCVCNEELSEVLLCEDDQDTVVIEVTGKRYRVS